MPTVADILNARRQQSVFDRVQGGSSTTAPVPTIFDRLAPSSPMQGITLASILERGGQTLGRFGREVPNEIAANYADIIELARQNPGAFGPAALPITLANIARGYQQGQEREARGGEASLTETPFATHTSGDPTVKGAAMIADPGNLVGTGIGAKIATGAAKLTTSAGKAAERAALKEFGPGTELVPQVAQTRLAVDRQAALKQRQLIDFGASGREASRRGEPRVPPPGPPEIQEAWVRGWDEAGLAHPHGGATIDQGQKVARRGPVGWDVVTNDGRVLEGGFASQADAALFGEAEVGIPYQIVKRK